MIGNWLKMSIHVPRARAWRLERVMDALRRSVPIPEHEVRMRRFRFRVLNIVDDVTRKYLGAIPDTSISGRRVTRGVFLRRVPSCVMRRGGEDIGV